MTTAKSSHRLFFYYALGLVIMFGGWLLPAPDPLTPLGVKLLGIFIALAFLWSVTDGIWASMLGLIAIYLTGYAKFAAVAGGAFGNNNVLVIFFSLILMGAVIASGTPKYISHFLLTKKIIDGRPIMFTFIVMFATYLLGALTGAIPAILMFWPIAYNVLEEVGYKRGDQYSTILVISIFFAACLGSAALPFTGAIIVILSAFQAVSGVTMNFLQYMTLAIITALLLMILFCLLTKFVFRPDLSKIRGIDSAYFRANPLPPMSLAQKLHLLALLAYILGVTIPLVMPKDLFLTIFLKDLGPAGVALLVVALLLMVRSNGKPIMDFRAVVHSGVQWNVYFMVAAAVYISGAMASEQAGVLPFLKNMLSPVLDGHGAFGFAAIMVGFGMIITSFMHNGVLGAMLMPIVITFSQANGYNMLAIAAILTLAINISFMTPAASVYAPLLHSNREWISGKDLIFYGGIFYVMAFLCFIFIGLPIANVIFSV